MMCRWTKFLMLGSLFAVAACKDTTDPEHEIHVESLRLTIGTPGSASTQIVTIASNPGCAVSGGPIALTVNQAHTITATFLNDEGEADPHANDPEEFRLAGGEGQADPTPTPASITFSRAGAFSGTLTGTTATSGSVFLSLLHPEEGHEDWGPCSVPITVAP